MNEAAFYAGCALATRSRYALAEPEVTDIPQRLIDRGTSIA